MGKCRLCGKKLNEIEEVKSDLRQLVSIQESDSDRQDKILLYLRLAIQHVHHALSKTKTYDTHLFDVDMDFIKKDLDKLGAIK